MGLSLKKVLGKAIPAIGAATGGFLGGTSGAGTGYQIGNMVSGAVGLGSDGVDSTDKAYMRYQMNLQNQMSDRAFQQNLQMWNLNNAYNDPSAQMERLEKAGLNKNLVYGGNNVTGNTSGSMPTYDSGSVGMVDKRAQRAQLALALQEHQQRITNQAIENELARERIGLAERTADREDRLADAQIQAYKANLGLTNARTDDLIQNPVDRRPNVVKEAEGINDLVRPYKDKIASYAERLVDFVYPTRNPSDAYKKANKNTGRWVTNYVTHKKQYVRRK